MKKTEFLILGAGLSGLSASFHVGHERCLILEQNSYPFGLAHSYGDNGYTWDLGPHVSFTKNEYVRELFSKNAGGDFHEFGVSVGNYFNGHWVDHPVQANLFQIPEPLRSRCVESFLEISSIRDSTGISNYREWLDQSLGKVITDNFVAPYTRKYWTTEPENLGVDWIGSRVFKPTVEAVINGAKGNPVKNGHYISAIRYPKSGGFQSFVREFAIGANILTKKRAVKVDTKKRIVVCEDSTTYSYDRLIVTIPLPEFVRTIEGLDQSVVNAAEKLACSQLLLVNVEVPHTINRPEHWFYVYDEDKFSTRITFTEKLSGTNAPKGRSGIQVEVYFSLYRPYEGNSEEIAKKVVLELLEMGLIESKAIASECIVHTRWVEFANIIFDHNRKESLEHIFSSLVPLGLARRSGDLNATTDWGKPGSLDDGNFFLLGRFGEWKYHWSDDAVLCGKLISESL